MNKILFVFTIIFSLSACVEKNNWVEVRKLNRTPLTSSEVSQKFVGNTVLVGKSQNRIYINSSYEFINDAGNVVGKFVLLKNGILCTLGGDRRFCFRVYENNGSFFTTYANGEIHLRGQIIEGRQVRLLYDSIRSS